MTDRFETSTAPIGSCGHLVVKRGHHGRYRFAMMTADGRIKGEAQVDVAGESRAALQAKALPRISSVVDAVSAAVAARIAAADLEACPRQERAPTRGARINGGIARTGEHRGQV